MLINYFKTSFRNILRYKGYSALNISGLAIGITSVIFILLYIQHEMSYDQYNVNKNSIYRIVTENHTGTPAPLATACQNEIPEIKSITRIDYVTQSSGRIFKYNDKSFNEKRFIRADPSFFEIFTFNFIKGNPKTALSSPNSIVITETTAKKYFDNDNPIGKSLNYENETNFIVTGVIKDVPENSHFHFDMVAQFTLNIYSNWGSANYFTYFILAENANPDLVVNKINDTYKKNRKNNITNFHLQKLTDIHLNSHLRNEMGQNGFISNIYHYSAIALIILIIACFNYTNLITAQYSKRTNEIGVRKVIGANKRDIIGQFMMETMLYILGAVICAIVLYKCLSPLVNDLLGKQLYFSQLGVWNSAAGLIGIAIVTTLISGSYPVFYLSSLNPINTMKDSSSKAIKNAALRKTLLVLQFSVSMFFIMLTILISQQMDLFTNKKLGFDKEHILNINLLGECDSRIETMKAELIKYPEIKQTSVNDFLLSQNQNNQGVWWEGLEENDDEHGMSWVAVDNNFLQTFNMKLKKGNNFSNNKSAEEYILNESAAKLIGWNDPVGKKFGVLSSITSKNGRVVGVVEDFHFKSLRDSIMPCALLANSKMDKYRQYMSISLASGNIPNTIDKIKKLWVSLYPERPFEYFFFDEDYNAIYKDEQKTAKIFSNAAILSIAISFLGLFGMIAITVEQKLKEIALRKVLGASASNIVLLISKDFAKLILIANLISWPIAYYFIKEWLKDFAYKIDVSLLSFLAAGMAIFFASILIVAYKAIKTSLANPVDSLKSE